MDRRARLVDVAVAVVVLGLSLPVGSAQSGYWAGSAVSVLAAAALLVRRARPLPVLGATGVLALAQVALALPSTSLAAVLVAVWTVADRRERRVSLQAAGLVALPLVVLVTATAQDRVDALVLALALLSAAWALGAASRSRRQVLDALRERADRLEDERVARAAAAVSEERLRILREMHDGLGHALTVIAVQADAAGAVLDTDPGRSRAAVAEVADVARSALAELRGIVHAGRHPPPPDLAGLGDLVAAARRAGTDVTLTVTGALDALLPGPSAAAFRVVQECLTNVQRHGGPSPVAEVDVAVGGAVLRISVRSRSAAPAVVGGQPAGATAGTGLLAMQERVSAFGGSCEHGWTADRTFRVQAAIPLQVDRP